jgi:hypothetical protein
MSKAHRNVPPDSRRPSLAPRRSPLPYGSAFGSEAQARRERQSRRPRALRCAPRRLRERRGVLLLVVLSILVLFVLLTVTYVIVASKERVTSKAAARVEISGDPPSQVCDSLMMMLLRDTTNPHSPFHTWSLLEGIYGNLSFHGSLDKASGIMDGGGTGQRAKNTGGQFYYIALTSTPTGYRSNANYYAGCVLTMLTGPCAGVSTRVIGSDGSGLVVMRFRADAGLADPSIGDAFVVNGPAYSGMGRGYDPTYTAGSAPPATQAPNGYIYVSDPNDPTNPAKNWEYALLPNPAYFQKRAASGAYPDYDDPAGWGGANVDYTAYDYNNMYLGLLTNDTSTPPKLPPVLPSFHRSELYAYWNEKLKLTTGITPALERKISFRPTQFDHPIFCSTTNLAFNTARPDPKNPTLKIPGPAWPDVPLDVDNMGTGVPDSIWIDPGLPVMTTRDGRTYKVMVAPLILDMDGRVNLNAHGSALQGDPNYPTKTLPTINSTSIAVTAGQQVQLPPGEGYGPAEISLRQLFSAQDVQNLLAGNGTYQGRHGVLSSSIASRSQMALKCFEYPPNDYRSVPPFGGPLTSFGTPDDIKGRRFLALDNRGQPLYLTAGFGPDANDSIGSDANPYWQYELFGDPTKQIPDSPYGFDLSAPKPGRLVPSSSTSSTSLDNPFTVAELERVMRPYDIDNRALAPRLAALLQTALGSNVRLPGQITTESWDLPIPGLGAPREFRTLLSNYWQQVQQANLSNYPALAGRGFQVADFLRAKLYDAWLKDGTVQQPMNQQQAQKIQQMLDAEVGLLLSPDVMAGLKMDINRPFGNGRDDLVSAGANDPHIVDAVTDEAASGATQGIVPGTRKNDILHWPSSYPTSLAFNITNGVNGNQATDPLLKTVKISASWKARQLMARYLYVLAMTFSDFSNPSFNKWTTDPSALANIQELNARRVAQWAINAACFRDSSSAMTPFEYQSDIFQRGYKGWLVDGDPATNEGPAATGGNGAVPGRRIVWGCKPPDLVLAETLALHDCATADTDFDGNTNSKTTDGPPKTKDNDYDQVRVPQGSLFIELYCCRNPNNPVAPGDLYAPDPKSGKWCLELNKAAPDGNPVWRMGITEAVNGNPTANLAAATSLGAAISDTAFLETAQDDGVTSNKPCDPFTLHVNQYSNPTQQVKIERIIWLGKKGTAPDAKPHDGLFYSRTNGKILIPPSQYAVVGPRSMTYVGSISDPTWYCVKDSAKSQSIKLTATPPNAAPTTNSALVVTNTALPQPALSDIKPVVGVVVAADRPAGWIDPKTAPEGIGLNASEPLPTKSNYYPMPTVKDPGTNITDAYGGTPNPSPPPNGIKGASSPAFHDHPLDYGAGDPKAVTRPLTTDGVSGTGTHTFYKSVILQRLADPERAWDRLTNPYITVDWMPIDLTTFSGEDPQGQTGSTAASPAVQFASRQRGGPTANVGAAGSNLWGVVQKGTTLPVDQPGAGTANFNHSLQHTFGYLNVGFGQGMDANAASKIQSGNYLGDPQYPFPWITWNARPYANLMELLLVPASSPDRLLLEFNSPATSKQQLSPYDPSALQNLRFPFNHLLNFLSSADQNYTSGQSANLYRVLDYLRVPSRFVGTETILSPKVFTASSTNLGPFCPPFNSVSNYRDPGLVNINTITAPEVWNAISNGFFPPNFFQANLINSRRGDNVTTGSLVTTDANFPTSFANPFRSAASADLVPLSTMIRPPVNATLMRPEPAGTTIGASGQVPLFGMTAANPQDYNNLASQAPYNDSSRNPYFAYQGLERISNNVTTRSNVFAIWLTVGYFEVLPWPQQGVNYGPGMPVATLANFSAADFAAHADGYQLGAELGSDTGEIVRHRAFYIIDRSIPVGYERGQNHNVNRAILLRRFIE